MNEEFNDPLYDTEETETSGSGDEQQNNTSNASEGANTQKTASGRETAQQRIESLARERNDWKGKYEALTQGDKPSSAQAGLPEDKLWKARMETKLSAPEHLKSKTDEIASYSAQYGVPVEDAIAIFDSKSKLSQADVEAQNRANAEASQSRTGGTANPAARSETQDVNKMETKDLESQLKSMVASGEKL